ncbi:hypothetical protein CQ052_04650 [Ochrobactrum sp. MYb15]|nr:hypothetical protein CWE02_18280 [Brucella pituitosa]PQZ51992.1 hypothetical protein CQZ90_04240 [Ochrobactrum sp. MYb19]PRA56605.1 hypothetical protein CQ062_08080 [Ochrobactrum sp. MYb68]PRA62682.1 hypothetical protein CQ053_17625 [Ochrobactrum sp. MYb18]PRA76664.1 hypothetical protein CQ049_04650 [Brucella thiophenivorans]PRA87215.1 hypothetical protein CQ054_08585 [Ochrobactrum sp. MYb29]PRA93703.1 hypothetical protein CQ051_04240 [Ochrobactrum sp. MYb14]PRA98671.1 hypothetical protei
MHKLGEQQVAKMCFDEKRKIGVPIMNSSKFQGTINAKNCQISPFFDPNRALLLKRNSPKKQSKRRFDELRNALKH